MDIANIKKAYEQQINAEAEIEARWKELIGFGCGYFDSYSIEGDEVWVVYDRPRGGGLDTDVIPLQFFETEDEKVAVKQYKEFLSMSE